MMSEDRLRSYPEDFYKFVTESIPNLTGYSRYCAICDFHKVYMGHPVNRNRNSFFNRIAYIQPKYDFNNIFLADICDTLLRHDNYWKRFRLGYNDLVDMDYYRFHKLRKLVEDHAAKEKAIMDAEKQKAEQEKQEMERAGNTRRR